MENRGATLNPPPGGVLNEDIFKILSNAWENLPKRDRPELDREFHRDFLYPLPPLIWSEDFVNDALLVIKGDPIAASRFRDHLDKLSASQKRISRSNIAKLSKRIPGGRDHLIDTLIAVRSGEKEEQIVSQDTILALTTATILSTQGLPDKTRDIHLANVNNAILAVDQIIKPIVDQARMVKPENPKVLDAFQRELDQLWNDIDDLSVTGGLPPWENQDFLDQQYNIPPLIDLEEWGFKDPWVKDVLQAIKSVQYRITSILPKQACPGSEIIIEGTGFGSKPGIVKFTNRSGETIDASPTSWGDKKITVIVPRDAVSSRIWLEAISQTIHAGGRIFNINIQESLIVDDKPVFDGGITTIWWEGLPHCPAPGSRINMRWGASNTNSVHLEVRRQQPSQILLNENNLPASGNRSLSLPAWATREQITIKAVASGPCHTQNLPDTVTSTVSVQHPYNLSIDRMELTSVNNIKKISVANEEEDAILRVYLRSGQARNFEGGRLPGVQGICTVFRKNNQGRWQEIEHLNPNNAPVTAQHGFTSRDVERLTLGNSLNFPVDSSLMKGHLRFSVRVESPEACIGNQAQGRLVWSAPKRLLLLADTHVYSDEYVTTTSTGFLGTKQRADELRYLCNQIVTRARFTPETHTVLIAGDIVEGAINDSNGEREWNATEQALEPLKDAGFEIHMVPGNHDYGIKGINFREGHRNRYLQRHETICGYWTVFPYVKSFGQWRLILLDSGAHKGRIFWNIREPEESFARGNIGPEQRAKLKNLLRRDDIPTVVALHHHPFRRGAFLELNDSEEFLKVLSNRTGKVITVCGHKHVEDLYMMNEGFPTNLRGIAAGRCTDSARVIEIHPVKQTAVSIYLGL